MPKKKKVQDSQRTHVVYIEKPIHFVSLKFSGTCHTHDVCIVFPANFSGFDCVNGAEDDEKRVIGERIEEVVIGDVTREHHLVSSRIVVACA